MSIDLLQLLTSFESINDHESRTAFFRTHVPWVAELAYLHVIFKPVASHTLEQAVVRLAVPSSIADFWKKQNGSVLFSGALSVYGIHAPGQLLQRDKPFERAAFDVETENRSWPPVDPKRFLAIGGYGFDGSTVCVDRNDCRVHLFERGTQGLKSNSRRYWPSIEDWITTDLRRLSALFDARGRRLVDQRLTLPHETPQA